MSKKSDKHVVIANCVNGVEILFKCQNASGEAQSPPCVKGGKRLPLLIKGSCPSAHTGAEGIRTLLF